MPCVDFNKHGSFFCKRKVYIYVRVYQYIWQVDLYFTLRKNDGDLANNHSRSFQEVS
jgi:hypothetical protein